MKIPEHIIKWRRFEAVRARLDPMADFELWFWTMLSSGTAVLNAALHAAGVTRENELFATQIPHVYAVRGEAGRCSQELANFCDLIHVDIPRLECSLPIDLDRAFAAMRTIESFRDPCIRSDTPVTSEVVSLCQSSYAELLDALRSRLQEYGI